MDGKVVIITGASSGIGAACAEILVGAGAKVVLAARRFEKVSNLAEKLGEGALAVQCDVTDVEEVQQMVDKTISSWGKIDVLINNAGFGSLEPIISGKLEDWHGMFNVNVNGLLSCIHKTLPYLVNSKGHIINMASVAAHNVFPNSVVYCATKHAVNAITVGFRMEFRDKVKVTNISPGAVGTEFVQHTSNEEYRKNLESFFDGIVLSPEDVARTVLSVLTQPDHVAINEVIIRPNR